LKQSKRHATKENKGIENCSKLQLLWFYKNYNKWYVRTKIAILKRRKSITQKTSQKSQKHTLYVITIKPSIASISATGVKLSIKQRDAISQRSGNIIDNQLLL
jgi:hypothetical protein